MAGDICAYMAEHYSVPMRVALNETKQSDQEHGFVIEAPVGDPPMVEPRRGDAEQIYLPEPSPGADVGIDVHTHPYFSGRQDRITSTSLLGRDWVAFGERHLLEGAEVSDRPDGFIRGSVVASFPVDDDDAPSFTVTGAQITDAALGAPREERAEVVHALRYLFYDRDLYSDPPDPVPADPPAGRLDAARSVSKGYIRTCRRTATLSSP